MAVDVAWIYQVSCPQLIRSAYRDGSRPPQHAGRSQQRPSLAEPLVRESELKVDNLTGIQEVKRHGGKRAGAGRKPGAVNRASAEAREMARATGITPLEFLLNVMRDDTKEDSQRLDAAKAAAPYVHAKLSAVEMNANVNVSHEDALAALR